MLSDSEERFSGGALARKDGERMKVRVVGQPGRQTACRMLDSGIREGDRDVRRCSTVHSRDGEE